MTKDEIQKSGDNKIKSVETLLRQLNLSMEARQVLTKEGVIEMAVLYKDNENYPITEDKKND